MRSSPGRDCSYRSPRPCWALPTQCRGRLRT
jgi:hypothetical protein